MTTVYRGAGIYTGLRTDTKPTTGVATQALFIETDSGKISQWNGTRWVGRLATLPSSRKTGVHTCTLTSSGAGDGLCTSMSNSVVPVAVVDADGRGNTYDTTGTQDTVAGLRASVVMTRRDYNPRMWIKFKLSATNDVRVWFGWKNASAPTGDTAMNSQSAIVFGIYAANNTTGAGSTVGWQIATNNGAATATTTNTGIAADTNTHTIEIIGDDAGAQFLYSLDGAAFISVTSAIPASTSSMAPVIEIQNSTANSKTITVYGIELEQDK